MTLPEVWAGIECSLVRVGDSYRDQLLPDRFAIRPGDLARIAALGVRAVRYPVLWEKVAPHGPQSTDWRDTDRDLDALRSLGVMPIVTLVHHGSGPRHTDLLDPRWPEKLAVHAAAVARRYPWVRAFTPVNEPLTTARFSALYGHWYPHARSHGDFLRAVIHQCRGVAASMRAIREITPDALLIQTEDFAHIASTPRVAYQAAYENERRWLSLDLLTGRVQEGHALYRDLVDGGIAPKDLAALAMSPTPPDIIGLNYYLTSERFLDERIGHYPVAMHGGNGRDAYVDVEAVRALARPILGHAGALAATWQRYHAPLAFTEVHLGCTREEQLRWWYEAWAACRAAKQDGIDVRAITAWSIFGSRDWDSLLTRQQEHYEPGAFDRRGVTELRTTALCAAIRETAAGASPSHPTAAETGWWRRSGRFTGVPFGAPPPVEASSRTSSITKPRPIIIVGGGGVIGTAVARECERRGLFHIVLNRAQLDITNRSAVARVLRETSPWSIINAAGYSRVDDAEHETHACFRANADGAHALAVACVNAKTRLVTLSTHLVFDGALSRPYVETDEVAPLNSYGRSKAEAERRVLAAFPDALIVRSGSVFKPWDEAASFVHSALDSLARGAHFFAANDVTFSPTYLPDLVSAIVDLLIDGERGVWHLATPAAVTWFAFIERMAAAAGISTRLLEPLAMAEACGAAPRPGNSALSSARAILLRPLDEAIADFVESRRAAPRLARAV